MKTHVYKLVLGFVLALLLGINLNAQYYEYIPLVKPGEQIWTNDYLDCSEHYFFRRFALTYEDTLIEGENYKKLYLFTDNVFEPSTAECIGGLRENAQKQVFYTGIALDECVGEGLIYDFSLSIGDTFKVEMTNKVYKITSIDTINIENISRKEFSIALIVPNDDTSFYEIPIRDKWIEGIGSSNGLLFNIWYAGVSCFNGGVNRCYEHNRELLYHNYSQGVQDCITPLLELNEIKIEENPITIYPNPAKSDLNIEAENKIIQIELFDMLGKRILFQMPNKKNINIDISSLKDGLYVLKLQTEKGVGKYKLVKN